MNSTEEQRLEHIIRRMQSDTAVDAPADSISYAKNLFRSRMTEPAKSVFERIMAVLSLDLAPDRAAFGERSTGEGQARQLLFNAGENAVDLRLKATDHGYEIRGQILGTGFENGTIDIVRSDSLSFTAAASDTSEFKATDIPAGEYALTVRGSEREIFIPLVILK